MRIKQATFVTSVADYKKCPVGTVPEIAIAGKSNVGKSSFINFLANNSKLARTSSTPGRTRLLNYFDINNGEFTIVDLPGYGYAKINDEAQESWGTLIEGYFATSKQLAHVMVLVDIRHEPGHLDKQMIAYLHHYNIPFTIIATKADKLSKVQIVKQKTIVANALCMAAANIYATSALNKTGAEEVLDRMQLALSEFDSRSVIVTVEE